MEENIACCPCELTDRLMHSVEQEIVEGESEAFALWGSLTIRADETFEQIRQDAYERIVIEF